MTYDALKKIAQPHIRENDNLPSNALLLLTQLHIPYKTEKQCSEDFDNKYNPLHNYPAFIYIDENKNKTMYFKTTTRYYNFYIFHEIAHYLLGHEDGSPQNELDADMLACILAAPIENFPTTIKTARDLSEKCNIPIDRAEEYWQEIKDIVPGNKKTKRNMNISIILAFVSILFISLFAYKHFTYKKTNNSINIPIQQKKESNITDSQKITSNQKVFVTISGEKYHLPDCSYVKYKTNLTKYDINEAIEKQYQPCSRCFSQ